MRVTALGSRSPIALAETIQPLQPDLHLVPTQNRLGRQDSKAVTGFVPSASLLSVTNG